MAEINPPPETDGYFVGRQAIFARLQQQILDPLTEQRHALVFTGHDGIGKSALLKQFSTIFDDPLLSIYTALTPELSDKDELLGQLVQSINQLLADHNFSLSRIPEFDANESSDFSEWLRVDYLPMMMRIIRPHRRLVWLLDDAEHLLNLSDDILSYLQQLLTEFPQVTIILTLSTEYDDKLSQFQPLINPVQTERIPLLNESDSIDLLQHYLPGINDTTITEIVTATGGHPHLLTRYGETLQRLRAESADTEAYQQAKTSVYQTSQVDFKQTWSKLTRDERLTLSAIASLIYDDPLQVIRAQVIEAWLVETDHVLDIVAVNAALRSLDYRDIIVYQQGEGLQIQSGLMQQWLLEQARIDEVVNERRGQLPTPIILLALVIIIIIVVVLSLVPPQLFDNTAPIVTATLAS